ncbi:MAG: GNVR domain-containing protein [Syntrophobacteraceae bacterium]
MANNIQRFDEGKENALREFLFVIFERRKIVRSIFIPVFLCSVIIAVLLPSTFRSSTKFSLLLADTSNPLEQIRAYDYKDIAKRYLQEQKELVVSDRVLQKVVEKLFPDTGSENIPKRVEQMRKRVEVTPPKGESFEDTSVFYVSVTGDTGEKAAEAARIVSSAYLEVYNEFQRSRTEYSYDFFKEQTASLHGDMLQKEKILRDYEAEHAAVLVETVNLETGATAPAAGASSMLTQLTRKYLDFQEDLAGLNVATKGLEKEEKGAAIPAIPADLDQPGRTIAIYKNKVAQLQVLMNEMKSQFTGQFGPIKQAEKELNLNVDSMKQELARTIHAQKISSEVIAARLQELEKSMKWLQEQIRSAIEERSAYESKRQQYQLAKDAYVNVSNQMEQARLADAVTGSKQRLRILDEPSAPLSPIKPDRLAIIIAGFFAGLLLGVATAATLDYFDHTIKKPKDIERFLNVPMLGSIPKVG